MSKDTAAPHVGAPDLVVDERQTVSVVGPSLLARLGAESFGTFFLVLAILGVALYGRFSNAGLTLASALAGGLALMAAVAAVGHVSGGHFNPAVTLGAAIGGRTAWRDLLPYWLAQLVGAVLAGLVLFATIPQAGLPILQQGGAIAEATRQSFLSSVANGYGDDSPLAAATNGAFAFDMVAVLLIEVVVTAVFVGIILGVTDQRSTAKIAPVAIGLALTVGLLIAAPFSGGSLNPARSFAAAVFAGDMSQVWLFIVAPLAGAAIAALFYRAFAVAPEQDDLLGEDKIVVEEQAAVVEEQTAAEDVVVEQVEPAVEPAAPEKPREDGTGPKTTPSV
ncbi:aquaporin [Oerskovia flava]|uniref:aquaporin n=1 Tax=Oerskovia flava TaxID=2986422 RepID=UPI002240D3D3|nr:aquaporin [Oerskovia sp. JB1-3-2]